MILSIKLSEFIMSRICEITGKRPARGRKYAIRGIAKKKKGIGLKTTGITKRNFYPNLFKKRLWDPKAKKFITLKLSAAALRNIDKHGLSTALERSPEAR
jgi:large subunit ribosomal protein L28